MVYRKYDSRPFVRFGMYNTLTGLNYAKAQVYDMSCVMRKAVFKICENKDADQLRSNCAADQRLFFAKRIVQSLLFLNFIPLDIFCGCTARFMSETSKTGFLTTRLIYTVILLL